MSGEGFQICHIQVEIIFFRAAGTERSCDLEFHFPVVPTFRCVDHTDLISYLQSEVRRHLLSHQHLILRLGISPVYQPVRAGLPDALHIRSGSHDRLFMNTNRFITEGGCTDQFIFFHHIRCIGKVFFRKRIFVGRQNHIGAVIPKLRSHLPRYIAVNRDQTGKDGSSDGNGKQCDHHSGSAAK